jgi:hypothetical protein
MLRISALVTDIVKAKMLNINALSNRYRRKVIIQLYTFIYVNNYSI